MKVFATTAVQDLVPGVSTYLPLFNQLCEQDRFGKHGITDNPDAADIILFLDGHQHYQDLSMSAIRRHPLVRKYRERAFVYSQQDQPWCAMPGLYVSMPRESFNWRRQRPCAYVDLPNKHTLATGPGVAEPELLYSFAGRGGNRTRDRILRNPAHPRASITDTSSHDFFGRQTEDVEKRKRSYAELLERSKFILCPRGAGASSFRIFETMAAGRVPVILSDAWMPCAGPDWKKCAIFISERDVDQAGRLIEEQEGRFAAMAQAARDEWRQWFSPEVLFHRMVESLRDILENRPAPEAQLSRSLDLRYWRLRARSLKGTLSHAARQCGGSLRARLRGAPGSLPVASR